MVANGELTQAEADRLAGLGVAAGRLGLIVNVLSIFGALAVSAGVLALAPSPEIGLLPAAASIGAGAFAFYRAGPDWRVLAHGLIVMGVIGLSGWIAIKLGSEEHPGAAPWLIFGLVAAAAGWFRQPFLAALAPLALGSCIGAGSGYWHASYAIFVRECLITIVVFSALAALLYAARDRLAEIWASTLTSAARVSFFVVNFGFWVGSLWGDYPGRLWATPDSAWWSTPDPEAHLMFVPGWIFSIGWAAFLGACVWLGMRDQRRFLANTALTFLSIHAYTQFFETLGAQPWTLIVGGGSMLGVAAGIAKFDAWNIRRNNANAASPAGSAG